MHSMVLVTNKQQESLARCSGYLPKLGRQQHSKLIGLQMQERPTGVGSSPITQCACRVVLGAYDMSFTSVPITAMI